MPLAAMASTTLLAACESPFNSLHPAGPKAASLAILGWSIIILMLLITAVMTALVVKGALRPRGNLTEHMPIDDDGGRRWLLVGGVAVPVTVLTILFFVSVGTLRALRGGETEADLRVEVIGHQWWWEIRYVDPDLQRRFATANELHIPVGKKVLLELKSADVIHSFWVPRLHGKMDLIPGHTNYLALEAGEAGVYRGECAEFCGVQHAHMRFLVVAEAEAEYEAWAARQRQPAALPATEELLRGRAAFEQYACALCHTIRGTEARGSVAPDLTHMGSRLTIAGSLPNKRGWLQAWIVDAQSLKPGVRMPSLNTFDGATLNALASYLESLQ